MLQRAKVSNRSQLPKDVMENIQRFRNFRRTPCGACLLLMDREGIHDKTARASCYCGRSVKLTEQGPWTVRTSIDGKVDKIYAEDGYNERHILLLPFIFLLAVSSLVNIY